MRGAAPRPPNMFSYILPILTADNTREGAVQTNERLRLVTGKVTVSYNTVKGALIGMHERYEHSKAERNVFRRYALLKAIVKEVIQLDAQYWLLLDVPKQDKQEQVSAYVLRACAVLEKSSDTRPQGEASKSQAAQQAEEEAREKERKARLEAATVQQIEEENTLLINDLYRLLKKYANLRLVVHTLHLSYRAARMYPIFPRYNMLKDMIRDVLRDPSYMEVCHEES